MNRIFSGFLASSFCFLVNELLNQWSLSEHDYKDYKDGQD